MIDRVKQVSQVEQVSAVRDDISSKPGSSGWHLALKRAVDGNAFYLGDTAVVDALVRNFIGALFDRHSEVAAGTMDAELARNVDGQECEKLAAIFAGQDPAYTGVGDWNGEGLKAYVVAHMDGLSENAAELEPEAVLLQVFVALVLECYEAITAFCANGDTQAAQERANSLAEDWVHLLMGIADPENVADEN